MVIQRLQTLFLLIACILMGIFCCSHYALISVSDVEVTKCFVKDAPAFLTLNIAATALLFIAIFLFKNLKLQMRVTLMCIVLLCGSLVTEGVMVYTLMKDAAISWAGIAMPALAIIFAALALQYMKKDEKLLKSYDRLR